MTTPPTTRHSAYDVSAPQAPAQPGFGWTKEDRQPAAGRPHAGRTGSAAGSYDGQLEPTHHLLVPPPAELDAADPTARDEAGSGGRQPAVGTGRRQRLAGKVGRWFDDFRFISEDVGSLRKQLRRAKEAHYNGSQIPIVRAAHIAFFWLFTAPIVSLLLCVAWILLDPVRFATAFVINLPVSAVLNHVPALADIYPDVLDCTTWSTASLLALAGVAAAFVALTVVVLLVEGAKGRR
jgi:hypothetical protein